MEAMVIQVMEWLRSLPKGSEAPREELWRGEATWSTGMRRRLSLKSRPQTDPEEMGTRVGLPRGSMGLGLRANGT